MRQRRKLGIEGATLAELMITLVLFGMLLTGVLSVTAFGQRISHRMEASVRAALVSDLILDQMAQSQFWDPSQAAYDGFEIVSLSRSIPEPEEHPEVIRIDLEIVEKGTGYGCKTSRYVKNRNKQEKGAEEDGKGIID